LVIYAAMKKTVVHLCLMIAAAWLASPLRAVVMIPLSVEEMTERATLIVNGTVLGKTCQKDAAGRIFTKIELKIAEVWKGSAPNGTIQVVHGGGRLDGRESVVAGQVDYQPGEEVVGFFVVNDRGEAVTLGLAQGKFQVWKDATTGRKLTANLFHGERRSANLSVAVSANDADSGPLTLDRLKRQVEGVTR
jgi:hypothetical protein